MKKAKLVNIERWVTGNVYVTAHLDALENARQEIQKLRGIAEEDPQFAKFSDIPREILGYRLMLKALSKPVFGEVIRLVDYDSKGNRYSSLREVVYHACQCGDRIFTGSIKRGWM